MTIYSQRDKRWKDDKMGLGTIGQYGCTMTCIAMKSNTEPGVLNREIKEVGGYSGNYIVWDKLDQIKDLDFIKRVKVYDNNDVKNNLPCLVEVDGTPIGGSRHWILYIGNQKCWDPWDGKEKPTSTYTPVGYAVVNYIQPKSPELPKPVEIVPVTSPEPPQTPITENPTTTTSDTPTVTVTVNPTPEITPVSELPTQPNIVPVNIKTSLFLRFINWLLSLLPKSSK